MACGEVRLAGVFSTLGSLRAGVERHGTVAVWTESVARRDDAGFRSPPAQNVRRTVARPGLHRMAAGARSVEGGMERLGLSRSRDRGIGLAVVPPARRRDAWSRSHGTNGADSVRTPELFDRGDRHCADEELVRS